MAPVEHAESADGTAIAYRRLGDGEPVVFVHGTATSGADWTFVRPHLDERFSLVAIDRRGRGESGDGPEYSIEREAEDILAVLGAVGADLLVAHSYGALCSIVAAGRSDRLRRLVLYEPPIAVPEDRVPGAEALVARGELDTALEAFLRAAGTPDDQLALIRNSPAWPVLLDAVPAIPRELRHGVSWPRPAGPIEVPTLFLLGADTDSGVYLDGLDQVLALFTDLRRATIPGQRHVAHVFAAEHFARLVGDFLAAPG